MKPFDHEKLDVYRAALAFVRSAKRLRPKLVPGNAELADQLDRAALSVVLNIAEGAGEFARREKARFYRMARRSATECAATLDVARELGLIEPSVIDAEKRSLWSIVGMLVALAKSLESRPHPPPVPPPAFVEGEPD